MSSIYYQIALGRVGVAMAKPSGFRAEQPLAPDLSTDRSIHRGGPSSTSPRRDIVFVVNPRGLSLFSPKNWPIQFPFLYFILSYQIEEHYRSATKSFSFNDLLLFFGLKLEQVQMVERVRSGRNYFRI